MYEDELGISLRDANKILSGIHHLVGNLCVGTTMASMEGQNQTRQSVNCFSGPIFFFQVSLAACVFFFFFFFSLSDIFSIMSPHCQQKTMWELLSVRTARLWKTDPSCKRLFQRISSCSKDLMPASLFFFFVKMFLKLSDHCLHVFSFITAVPPHFLSNELCGIKCLLIQK